MSAAESMDYAEAERTGDWVTYEKTREHYGPDGWCRCCCNRCSPVGCGHRTKPKPCPAHPTVAS